MRYGNGGFVSRGTESSECNIVAGEFAAASTDRWSAIDVRVGGAASDATWSLPFFFTRPCSKCQVRLRYRTVPLRNGAVVYSHDFPMLDYATTADGTAAPGADPMTFSVRTCGVAWMLAGVPMPAVKRRAYFSITAWRVDSNRLPAWSGDTTVQVISQAATGGNGGGGELVVSSRTIVAVPHSSTRAAVPFTSAGQRASWVFDAYAADEIGDRSFSVGGPTYLSWTPRWAQGIREGADVALRSVEGLSIKTFDRTGPVTISSGADHSHMSIGNGTKAFNGVPFGQL
eukprot:gene14410-53142_t